MNRPLKAIVVFHDSDEHPLSFMLKKGFRHCFVCLKTDTHWVQINLLFPIPHISVVANADYNLVDYYRKMNYTVVETRQRGFRMSMKNPLFGILMIANCVGIIKTVLGINSLPWTPYSLYRELTK